MATEETPIMKKSKEDVIIAKNVGVFFKKGKLQDVVLTGSKSHADYLELKKMKAPVDKNLMPLSKQYNELNDEYIKAIRAKKDSATLEGYKDKLDAIRDKMEP